MLFNLLCFGKTTANNLFTVEIAEDVFQGYLELRDAKLNFACDNCRAIKPKQIFDTKIHLLHQSRAASTWWCSPQPRLGWVEMAVGFPKGPSYPRHSPSLFRYAAP